jgi:hypothetical protein
MSQLIKTREVVTTIATRINGYFVHSVHIATAVLFLVSQAGCATEPGETTVLGGVAGATLGAGLGAIIGNQIGDPGSGVAIGGIAGGLAGTMVANEMESSNRKLALQEEMTRRQRETLNSQQKALSELRALDDDGSGEITKYKSRQSLLPDTWSRSASYKGSPSSTRSASNSQSSSASVGFSSASSVGAAEYSRPDKSLFSDSGDEIKASQVVAPVQKAEKNSVSRPSSIFSPVNSEKIDVIPDTQEESQKKQEEDALAKEKVDNKASPVISKKKVAPPYEPPKDKSTAFSSSAFSSSDSSSSSSVKEAVSGEAATEISDSLVPNVDEFSSKSYVTTGQNSSNDPQAKAVAELGIKAKDDKPGNTKEVEKSIECKNAEIEANKSAQATEVPDKLFHLRRALRLCPSDPQYHYGLGKVYSTVGRTDDARYEFQEALKVDPKFAPALKEIGTVP